MTNLSQPALSICTPTYNRAALLRELLERIVEEVQGDLANRIEVVVSDNASSDDTPAVVESYRKNLPHLTVVRHAENLGFDRNMLAAVASASGRYCWLMGDDDLPQPGSIARVLAVLNDYPNLCGITIDRVGRSFDLKTELPEDPLGHVPETVVLYGPDEVFQLFAYYLGFISAQVVHRDTWMEVVQSGRVDEFCNAYVHVYMIGAMLQRRAPWLVLRERLVVWRADNDSALSQGYYRRTEIDVVGFEQISRSLFGVGSATYKIIRDKMAIGPFRYGITKTRLANAWVPEAQKTRKLALKYYSRSPKFWLVTAPFVFAPAGVDSLLRLGQRVVHRRRARRLGLFSKQ